MIKWILYSVRNFRTKEKTLFTTTKNPQSKEVRLVLTLSFIQQNEIIGLPKTTHLTSMSYTKVKVILLLSQILGVSPFAMHGYAMHTKGGGGICQHLNFDSGL